MEKQRSSWNKYGSRSSVTGVLALLVFICLAECATGSCLSYGHSCWGAHGKRSGKPASAPDWYLSRILRRMAALSDLSHPRQMSGKSNDIDDIFRVEVADDAAAANQLVLENEDGPVTLGSRTPEAKPMLDDEMLSKIKLWQIMREASEDK